MTASTNLPGYSGHIPFKTEFVGMTNGAQNQACENEYRSLKGETLANTGNQILTPAKGS